METIEGQAKSTAKDGNWTDRPDWIRNETKRIEISFTVALDFFNIFTSITEESILQLNS